MTTAELKDSLTRHLALSAENLVRLAILVNELESRGEDLTELRIGLLPILRLIAFGKLLPEAVEAFAGQVRVIKQLATMPLDKQKAAADRGFVARKPRASSTRRPNTHAGECGLPSFKDIATKSMPRDVAAMAAELICACEDPALVLQQLLAILKSKGVTPPT